MEISLRLLLSALAVHTVTAFTALPASPPSFPSQQAVGGRGVTVLWPVAEGVVVGDKGGNLAWALASFDLAQGPIAKASFCRDADGLTERQSPVFSLDYDARRNVLFSGAGDRYVSVWETEEEGTWSCKQKLGPHTGWVKDILVREDLMLVHSIGCNCIETWRMTESGAWEHFQKSAIESSPTGGATLSSDLLCLCPLDESAFLAGGVDGRVHLWKSVSMDTPLLSFSAHDGRVNDMKRAKQTDHVFTAGNDGRVCCWKTSSTGDALGLVGQAVFGDSRISSLWSLGVDGADYVFCGTNVGEVSLLSLDDTTASFRRLTTFQLAGQPTIHSLCVHSEQDPHLWIGHSNGLHIYSLSSILNLKPSSLVAL